MILPPEGFPPPPFERFRPKALSFLRDLAANNDRAWMAANKAVFEAEIQAPMAGLVAALSARLAALPLRGDPLRAQFRLHRDVRFAADKSPFKTNAGAVLSRDGTKQSPGLLYIHIDPAGCFTAAGFYRPEPAALARLRAALVRDPARWAKALRDTGMALEQTDALARPPKGFDAAPVALAEDLKLKSWILRRRLTARQIGRAALVDEIAGFAETAAPLLRFGWAALAWRA